MSDERLRLVAEVQDGFTGPLAKLNTALQRTAATGTQAGKDLKRDFEGFHGVLGKTNSALQGMLAPLSGLGVAGLGAGLGLGAITAALGGFSKGTQQLAILSKETGLAVNELRAFGALGERFGVSAETMQGGVKRFSEEMSQLRKRYGEAYSSLQAMNLGELVEKLVNAPNMKAALDSAMEALSNIGDPARRRKVAEQLFGADQIGAVAGQVTGKYREMMREIQSSIGSMSKETEKAAADFEKNMSRMGNAAERLKLNVLGPLLKGLNTIVESGDRGGIRGNAEAIDADLQGRLKGAQSHRDELKADPVKNAEQLKSLEREIRNLTDAIRRSREGAGPSGVSAIPMSYSGPLGPAGGMIQKAGFGVVLAAGGGNAGGLGLGGFGGPLPTMGGGYGSGNPNVSGSGAGRGYGVYPAQSGAGVISAPPLGGGGSARGISARDMRNVHPEIAAYIRNSAARHGIDPDVALRIANSEGLRGSTPTRMTPGDKDGTGAYTSFGPFQLHYAGRGGGMSSKGMGDDFTRETGHHASDPRYWKEAIDFSMRRAAKGGWGPWHGRIGAGIGVRQGIGTYNGPIPSAEPTATASGGDAPYYQRSRSNVPGQMSRLRDDEIEVADSGGRVGDAMMKRAREFHAPAAPVAGGKGSLDITLHGFPAGTKPRASMDDLFKDVSVSKSRQMETTSI